MLLENVGIGTLTVVCRKGLVREGVLASVK